MENEYALTPSAAILAISAFCQRVSDLRTAHMGHTLLVQVVVIVCYVARLICCRVANNTMEQDIPD